MKHVLAVLLGAAVVGTVAALAVGLNYLDNNYNDTVVAQAFAIGMFAIAGIFACWALGWWIMGPRHP